MPACGSPGSGSQHAGSNFPTSTPPSTLASSPHTATTFVSDSTHSRAGETMRVITIKDLDMFAAIGRGRDAGELHANLELLRPKNPEAS